MIEECAMNEPLKLETETFRAFGRRWMGVRTALSPLESGAMPIAPAALQEYQAMGLLDAGGQPTPGLNSILSVLGQANAMVDLTLLAGGEEIQYTMYFSPAGAAPVLVTTIDSTTTIRPTASADPIVNDLAAIMPATTGVSSPFSADIPPKDALILAALMDQQRLSAHAAAAHSISTPVPPVVYYPPELEPILENFMASPSSWLLLSMVYALTDVPSVPGDEIGQAFSRLVSAGYLTRSGQGYILQQKLLSFANSLLSPQFSLLCTIRLLGPNARVSAVEFDSIGFEGGILSMISSRDDSGTLSLRIMAPEAFLDIVRRLAASPQLVAGTLGIHELPGMAPQPFQQEKGPSGLFCPACGSPAAPGAKFCQSCGAPLEQPPAAATCVECGQPLRPGAKFCPKCGRKVG
jgi:hypothetical protein